MSRKRGFRLPAAAIPVAAALLMLPVPQAAAAGSCHATWTVRAGDTLSRIAERCATTVAAIMGANPRIADPARLSIGWQLAMPDANAAGGNDRTTLPTGADGHVQLSGRVVNGRRCAKLKTEDGEVYGMVGPRVVFVGGQFVNVHARIVDDPSCAGPGTLLVTELTADEM